MIECHRDLSFQTFLHNMVSANTACTLALWLTFKKRESSPVQARRAWVNEMAASRLLGPNLSNIQSVTVNVESGMLINEWMIIQDGEKKEYR